MKKKLFVLMCLLLSVLIFNIKVKASGTHVAFGVEQNLHAESVINGEVIRWKFGKYQIEGKDEDFKAYNLQCENPEKLTGNVVIPTQLEYEEDGNTNTIEVGGLSDYALKDAVNVKSIIVPYSIKYIGSKSFENCSNVEYMLLKKLMDLL